MITLLAILWSIAGLLWLSAHDAKRALVFRRTPRVARIDPRLIWGAVLVPGLVFAVMGSGAAFVMWLGGTMAFGWMLIAVPEERFKQLWASCKDWLEKTEARLLQKLRGD